MVNLTWFHDQHHALSVASDGNEHFKTVLISSAFRFFLVFVFFFQFKKAVTLQE